MDHGTDQQRREKYQYHPTQRIPKISLSLPDETRNTDRYEIVGCDLTDDGIPIYQLVPALAVEEAVDDNSDSRHVEILNVSAELLDRYVSLRQIEAFEHRDPDTHWNTLEQDIQSVDSEISVTDSVHSRRRDRPDSFAETLQEPSAKRPRGRPPKNRQVEAPQSSRSSSTSSRSESVPVVATKALAAIHPSSTAFSRNSYNSKPEAPSVTAMPLIASRRTLLPRNTVANSSGTSSETGMSTADGFLTSLRNSTVLPRRSGSLRHTSRERSTDRVIKRRGRPPLIKPVASSTASETSTEVASAIVPQVSRALDPTPVAEPSRLIPGFTSQSPRKAIVSPRNTQQSIKPDPLKKKQTKLSRFLTASSTSSEDIIAPTPPIIPPSPSRSAKHRHADAGPTSMSTTPAASELHATMADTTIDEEEYEISHIVNDVWIEGRHFFEVAWVGYPLEETSMLLQSDLSGAKAVLKAYMKAKKGT